MKTLKQITQEMGEAWTSHIREQAKSKYRHVTSHGVVPDLTLREYENMQIRQVYAFHQREIERGYRE